MFKLRRILLTRTGSTAQECYEPILPQASSILGRSRVGFRVRFFLVRLPIVYGQQALPQGIQVLRSIIPFFRRFSQPTAP